MKKLLLLMLVCFMFIGCKDKVSYYGTCKLCNNTVETKTHKCEKPEFKPTGYAEVKDYTFFISDSGNIDENFIIYSRKCIIIDRDMDRIKVEYEVGSRRGNQWIDKKNYFPYYTLKELSYEINKLKGEK